MQCAVTIIIIASTDTELQLISLDLERVPVPSAGSSRTARTDNVVSPASPFTLPRSVKGLAGETTDNPHAEINCSCTFYIAMAVHITFLSASVLAK